MDFVMGEDGLTLEKLKIDERLRVIEQQVTRLVAHTESEAGNISLMLSIHAKSLEEHKEDFREHKKEDDVNFKAIDNTIAEARGKVIVVVAIVGLVSTAVVSWIVSHIKP